jgi:hypothetical protein
MSEATDGFQVGNAWIQMLPSFDGFHRKLAAKMAGIGDVKVPVEPEVSSAKLAAVANAMDERLSKTPIVKRVDLDDRLLRSKMAALEAKRSELKLRVDADISAALAKIAALEGKRGNTTINVDAEIAKAQAKIKALEAHRDTIDIQVDVDIDKAERALHQVDEHLTRLGNSRTDINMEAGDASRALAIVGLLTAGLSVVGQLAPAAAAAIAAIPAALAVAAQGVGAVIAGLSGISDATKALQAVDDEVATKSGQAAQQRVAATNRVASAQSSLERALEQADRSAIEGARQVQDAREAAADAVVAAARRVEDAERALTSAQQSSRDAQEALTRARKDAAENLEDLGLALSGAALDEEAAVLAVERAQSRLNAAQAAGVGGLDMAELVLGAKQAKQALAEVQERYGDLSDESADANRVGVDGSREVVAAQRQVEESATKVLDAERELAETRVDSAREVAKAQERVAEAQQQAGQAATDASRAVADAQRAVSEASVSAGDSGSAAMDKLAVTMGKLSPAGREFARFLQNEVKPALQDVGRAAQSTLLPRLEVAFQDLITLAPLVAQGFSDTGQVIGDLAIKGADMMTSGPWRADFVSIMARNNRVLGDMGNAGLSALDVMRNLTIAGGPLVEALAASTEGYLAQFQAWIQGKRDSGELATWFQEMSVRIKDFFGTVSELTGGVWNLLQAIAPLGRVILDIVAPFVQWLGAMAEANPVLTTVIALAVLGTSSFVSFFRTIGGLTQAFRTSTSVYQDLKSKVLGVKQATDEATVAAAKNVTATEAVGTTTGRTGGLVGKFGDNLRAVGDTYKTVSAATTSWAGITSTAVGSTATEFTGKLMPATTRAIRSFDGFEPATGRVRQALSGMAATAQTTLGNVAGAVTGSVAAVGRGIGAAASGLVGALGGPFGVAIAAATVGLGFLVSAQQDAAQAAAEHKARVQELTDALVESGGAIDGNVRKQVAADLRTRSISDNARTFGLNVHAMIDAITSGGDSAKRFEGDLRGLGDELINSNHLTDGQAESFRGLTAEMLKNGGSARDNVGAIASLADQWQASTGASTEARDAFKAQLDQYFDLVGGYRNSKGDFKNAVQDQKDIAQGQDDAATATERHTQALKKLQDQILGQIDADLAYRQSQQSLTEAQDRVAHATGEEMPAALLAEEQALIAVIQKHGDLAYAISTATTETGKLRDQQLAQVQTAVELAGKYSGTLPESLQTYLYTLITAKDETGNYTYLLDQVPPNILTKVIFDGKDARQGIIDLTTFMAQQTSLAITGFATNIARGLSGGKALGGVDIPAYAKGGVRPMSAKIAQIVPPNQPRLIGDRMRGAEGFIPINTEPRSIGILTEVAARMGFSLVPLAFGAVLGMADGGVTQAATPAATTGADAALTVNSPPVDEFTTAVQTLITAALAPLATEVTASTVPALALLEDHAGVKAVAAVAALAAMLPPLRESFAVTATAIGAAWLAATQSSGAGVTAIGGYLATLRYGLQQTGTVMTAMADWSVVEWGRVRGAAADPVRWVLQFPLNQGLIAAWNRLNSDFSMGNPIAPIAIPFREGGRVHGTGNEDKVRALLTPGEIVFDRLAISNLGGVAAVERMRKLARAGVIGPEQRLGGQPGDGAARLKLMRTVPLDGLGFAYGGVQPHVAAAGAEIEEKFGRLPGGIGGVGSRPNVSDHPLGLALDFMTLKDTALGNRIAGYLIANAQRMAVKYLIWQQKFNEGSGWTGMEDRGSPTANHMDHVHSSFLQLGQAGHPFSGEGAALDPAAYFADTYKLIGQIPALFPGNIAAARAAVVATQATDAAVKRASLMTTMGGTTGNVESWRPLVLQALRMLGLPLEWADITLRRMAQESGGNPRAINLTDSNAQRGDPSRGLMQTIMSTFQAYRDPRAPNDIYDGLANILASMRYTMARYGSLPAGYGRAGGYDGGGVLPPGYSTVFNGLSRPEMVLTDNQWSALISLATSNAGGGGDFRGNLYLSSGEFLGAVEGVIDRANEESGRVLTRRIR